MAPPLMTIDFLVSILKHTVLRPIFVWLLILAHYFNLATPAISLPTAALLFGTFNLARQLLQLDARLASGPSRRLDWSGEVVVITGGAGGLGSLIAKEYGERGVNVAVLDIKEEGGVEAKEICALGEHVRYYKCDVGMRGEVEAVKSRIETDLGVTTILVNNAAVVMGKPILELTAEDIDKSYKVNLLSNYHTIQTFLPGMLLRSEGGTVVTISSVLGYLGCASLSDYTSSKAALTALHNSLKAELTLLSRKSKNTSSTVQPHYSAIRTVLFTPGQIATPLFKPVITPSSFLGPVVETADAAKAVVGAIDGGRNEEVSMPLYAQSIAWMGVLPVGLRGIVRSLAGLDKAAWAGFGKAR